MTIFIIIIAGVFLAIETINLIDARKELSDLRDQNKFYKKEYFKLKEENEKLKKQLDPKYQVRTFKQQDPKKKNSVHQNNENNYPPGVNYKEPLNDRYDYVEVKSMKDMYDYHSR